MGLFTEVRGRGILGSSRCQVPPLSAGPMLSGFLRTEQGIRRIVHEKPIIPQASITLPWLPGLSFAGLREEQESERFRIVSNEKPLLDTAFSSVSSSVDARSYRIRSGPERGDLRLRNRPLTWRRFFKPLRRSGGPRPFREEEGERRACARRALGPYLAAVGLGDLAGYGQPKARTALGAGGISPVEAFEDEGQLILGDPNPRIRDRQRHATVFLLHPHLHAPPVWCVLDRVVKENGSHLHYPLPIEGGYNFVLVWYELHGHLAVISSLGSLLGYRTEIVTSYLHGCALIPPGQREQGLDQATHLPGLPADGVDAPMGGLLICIEGPLVEHPGVPAYGGEGGSQLVACVGGEAPLAREGDIEPRQQTVYRGGKASDLIIGVRNGQPLPEIPLPHPPRRGRYGFDRPQDRPC